MIKFNNNNYNLSSQLKSLNDRYEINKRIMGRFETNTDTYRQLYEENGVIVKEIKEVINQF